MIKTASFTETACSLAMLALAALPIAALSTAAHATTVKVSDLNLATSEGVAKFQARAQHAGIEYCSSIGTLSLTARASCRQGVAAELAEKMVAARTAQAAKSATFAAR
jgi:UrcA family protein